MPKILSFKMIIRILVPNLPLIYGISFATRPENTTFLSGLVMYFNCSTDILSDSGIDWVFTSFLRPDSENHVVQWHPGKNYTEQPGFAVERLNNLTSNLVILNPNSSLAGKYCCQYKNGHGKKKSCAYAKEINLPQNEVILAGNGVMLNCAQVRAFRWYRYLPTDLLDDKVIYMGSMMADDVDERFKVYTQPDDYPYDRLDLYISNVQTDLFGTYKCQQPRQAHCAEIIVLASEPVCNVRLVKKFGVIAVTAELTCSIELTGNAVPEMLCRQNTTGFQTEANCSSRLDGVVSCATEVDLENLPNIACEIIFNPKPLRKYATCLHVSNQPSYAYKWTPSSYELLQFNSTHLMLIAILAVTVIITCIQTSVIVWFLQRKLIRRSFVREKSIDSSSTKSSSLSSYSEENPNDSGKKPKLLDVEMIPGFPSQVSSYDDTCINY